MTHTIKSLGDLGSLPGIFTTDAKSDEIVAFIDRYQKANNGDTPAYAVIANEVSIPVESARALLARLENRGRIHFISRSPPRIMLVGPDTILPHEVAVADKEGAYDRFLDAESARHLLGRFIADCEAKGAPPSLKQMMEFVGYTNPNYVNRMAEILAERGLIQYGQDKPTKLTPQGRAFYVVAKKEEKVEQVTTAQTTKKRTSTPTMAQRLCRILAAHKTESGETFCPPFVELAVALGYTLKGTASISALADAATALGYIQPRKPRSRASLQFTDRGRAKFMLQAEPPQAEPPQAEPPPPPPPAPQRSYRVPAPEPVVTVTPAPPPPVQIAPTLSDADTGALIMELIERGYTVKKG